MVPEQQKMTLSFKSGTIILSDGDVPDDLKKTFVFDPRTGCYTARGCDYASTVLRLVSSGTAFEDGARRYRVLDELAMREPLVLRPHQG